MTDFISLVENSKFWTKSIAVIAYLYKNCDPDTGYVFATYKKIHAETGATEPVIAKVMTQLQDDGVITKVQNGVWQFNEVLVAG